VSRRKRDRRQKTQLNFDVLRDLKCINAPLAADDYLRLKSWASFCRAG
jgi:hypothetical protein